MNPKALTIVSILVGLVSYSNGQAATLALIGLSSGVTSLTTAGLTAFLSPAGAVAVGIGLVGAGIVKKSLAANVAGLATQDFRNFGAPSHASSGYAAPSAGYGAPRTRGRRNAAEERVEALEQIDAYFYSISNIDVDDCGKRLVCEVQTQDPRVRSEEEVLIAGLFGDTPLDPSSAKAEYDLAATLGMTTKSKAACGKRYHKCPLDRRTIIQGIEKQKNAALAAQRRH